MAFCGYDSVTISDEKKLYFLSKNKRDPKKIVDRKNKKIINKKTAKNNIKRDPNSPFAVLEKLL